MTAKDEVLVRLGEHLRKEQIDDARFERVARGEASALEIAELERAARTDPEVAVRLAGSRPVESASIDRIARLLTKQAPKVVPAAPKASVPVSARKARWMRYAKAAAGPLALAAVIAFVLASPSESSTPLPAYAVSVSSDQTMRGAADTSTRLHLSKTAPNRRFEIVVRPATAPGDKVAAYAFSLAAPGSEPTALDAKIDVSRDGAVKIVGASASLAGAREIRIVVAQAAAISRFDDAAQRAASNESDRRVAVFVVPIDRE